MILDFISELFPEYSNTQNYFGKPFIWNELLNFGGNNLWYGQLDNVRNGHVSAKANNANIQGIGITMEGIEQNTFMYDFMLDQ